MWLGISEIRPKQGRKMCAGSQPEPGAREFKRLRGLQGVGAGPGAEKHCDVST